MSVHSNHSVVIGGTHQEGDYDLCVREEDSKHIYDGCCRMMPSLKVFKILGVNLNEEKTNNFPK